MSSAEIAYRLVEQGKRRISKMIHYDWQRFEGHERVVINPYLARRLTDGADAATVARLRDAVETILAGITRIHDQEWPRPRDGKLFPAADWTLDPVTGYSWPGRDVFCFDINFRRMDALGDVKFVWDYNRLQFLQPLAAAVALWEDRRALDAIEQAIESWAGANAPFGGIIWCSGIELGLRAVSLALTASLCGNKLSPRIAGRIATILRAHLYWLRRFPSQYSSANNHLVAEALGALAICVSMPNLPGAKNEIEHARRTLLSEARKQILDDGVGVEQSPTYAAFTVEILLCADLFSIACGAPLIDCLRERFAAFVEFIRWLVDETGRVPNIGDDDGGRVISSFGFPENCYAASVAAAAAARFSLAQPVAVISDGPQLRGAFFPPSAPALRPPTGVRCFESGGYTVVREHRAGRRLRLVIDHGPLGYLSIAAHGHADANAFTLMLDDVAVFVDPGTYLYHSGGSWRNWFRSTRAHNTLTLDGRDQSTIAGPFNWSQRANARLEMLDVDCKHWSLDASHDGYQRRYGVDHRRRVEARDSGIAIIDRLSQPTSAVSEITFQLGADLSIDSEGARWVIRNAVAGLEIRVAFSSAGEISARAGGVGGEGGWVSRRFGVKFAAPRLVWMGRLPAEGLQTTISW
jgi:hypothetical protein